MYPLKKFVKMLKIISFSQLFHSNIHKVKCICLINDITPILYYVIILYTGMRLGLGKNSGKFYVAIDSNPIQHRRF